MSTHRDVDAPTRADREPAQPAPRVQLDTSICIGSGSCARLAPGAFTFDDEHQVAEVADPSSVDEARLALAERSCPTGAIFIDRT